MGGKQTRAWKHLYLSLATLIFFSVAGCSLMERIKSEAGGEAHPSLLQSQKLLADGNYEGALWENEKVISLSPPGPPVDRALFNTGMIHAHPGNPKKDYGKSLLFFKRVVEEYPGSPLAEEAKIWIGMAQEHDQLSRTIRKLGQRAEQRDKECESLRSLHGPRLLARGDYEGALRENQKAISSSPPGPPVDQALFNMGLIYAHPGNSKKDYGKSVSFFQKLIKDYPQSPLVEESRILIGMFQENDKLNRGIERLNRMIDESKKTIERLNQVIEESRKVDIQIEEKKREKMK